MVSGGPAPPSLGWSRGVEGDYLASLLAYWADSYDWRIHEARIRSLPWYLTGRQQTPVRAIHLRRPGFPFAAPVEGRGLSSSDSAEAVANLMTELGYDRYVISAGDVGCDIAEQIAASHSNRVAALHLTARRRARRLPSRPRGLDPREAPLLDRLRRRRRVRLQSRRAPDLDHRLLGQRLDRDLLHPVRRDRLPVQRANRYPGCLHRLAERPRQRSPQLRGPLLRRPVLDP